MIFPVFCFHYFSPCFPKLFGKGTSKLTGALFADTKVTAWNKDMALVVHHAHGALSPNILIFGYHATTCVCNMRHKLMQYMHMHTPSEDVDLYMSCIMLYLERFGSG